ncbi:MAG: DUF1343 domain-containing protein [Anaerolineae bacterium]|jgi:uncharacterized protein YbbC (DUF1343 family)|nr:DUF1343 domain-containing protein [Anaerolineae bacterium]
MPPLLTGLDALQADGFALLRGTKVGLLTHPAAVDTQLRSPYHVFTSTKDLTLTALLSPEHGLWGIALNGEYVHSSIDPRTGIPIHSLYGQQMRPTLEMLEGLDALVVNLQDIGARYYTFIWTLTHALDAAGAYGLPVIILDRPNPYGGQLVRGPGVAPGYESLVGRVNIPILHGLTIGEFAKWYNARHNPTPGDVAVVTCRGWNRGMTWADLRRPWISTSPAMPHLSTLQHYPGSCLVEGTTLSEGRGTYLPFEIAGAPGIEPTDLANALNALNLPGVAFRAHVFKPNLSKHKDTDCYGVQVHITGREFDSIRAWLAVMVAVRRMFPEAFGWTPPHNDRRHIDLLAGSPTLREMVDSGASVDDILAAWDDSARSFLADRREFLLYA